MCGKCESKPRKINVVLNPSKRSGLVEFPDGTTDNFTRYATGLISLHHYHPADRMIAAKRAIERASAAAPGQLALGV